MRVEPITLTGHHVQLEPLSRAHVAALVEAATDRTTYSHTLVPDGAAAMAAYVDGLHADAAAGTALPFAQRWLADGSVVGCTRYLNVLWWAGRPTPVEVEIGGTWLAGRAQRTAVNTEAKLLLLRHAFETLGVFRVAICTDALNERSRVAIERLGATFEGVLRSHRPSAGHMGTPGRPRDTAVYSLLDNEWPVVRTRLEERLHG